ncbi:hypothetical protein L7F22_002300 [Adiantum nelumboides]|nr:hypothetical protein [Adiantum nelumboides]
MPPRRVTRTNTKNLEILEVQNNIKSSEMPDIVLKEDFGSDKDLKTLLKTVEPEPFTVKDLDNASKLEEWIISMEDYFDLAKYNFVAKGIMGRVKIKGQAKIWWNLNCKSRGVLEITQSWEELQLRLREWYSPPNYLTTKMNEFLACVRRGRTIDTYYEDFIKLSRHAPLITEEQKLSRFILGLEEKLADEVEALRPTSLADALIRAKPKFSSFLKSNNQQGEQKREQLYRFESSHRSHKFQNMARPVNQSEAQPVRAVKLEGFSSKGSTSDYRPQPSRRVCMWCDSQDHEHRECDDLNEAYKKNIVFWKDNKVHLRATGEPICVNFGQGGIKKLAEEILHNVTMVDAATYGLQMAKRGKVSRGELCEAGNCICETTEWSDPVGSLSVYAYIAKYEAKEVWVEEKRKRDEERTSKRVTRSSIKKEEVPKPLPEVNMEDAPKDKKQGEFELEDLCSEPGNEVYALDDESNYAIDEAD